MKGIVAALALIAALPAFALQPESDVEIRQAIIQ